MNLEELRSVQDAERERSDLQPLRESFYEDAGDYIAALKAERDRAAAEAEDPFGSPDVRRLSDEIETAEEVVEAVYQRRLGKLVERASLAASGVSVDEDGLTVEERRLFTDLVDRMEASKRAVLDTLDPSETGSNTDSDTDSAATTSSGSGVGDDSTVSSDDVAAADLMSGDTTETGHASGDGRGPPPNSTGSATSRSSPEAPPVTGSHGSGEDTAARPEQAQTPDRDTPDSTVHGDGSVPETDAGTKRSGSRSDSSSPESDVAAAGRGREASGDADRVTVRITRDVGQILGVDDRQYDLAAEDVVRLPASNAAPLVERGAAERLD